MVLPPAGRAVSATGRPPARHSGPLWEALRRLRRELAGRQGVPPYVVFPDSTLAEMIERQPATLAEMAGITGVGARKLQRYGMAFLDLLERHRKPVALED
jgi:ATP-dependent DNA helicase RecQ